MKVFVILSGSKTVCSDPINWLEKHWKDYRMKHPEIPYDLEFVCRVGTDKKDISFSSLNYFFTKEEIDGLMEEIEALVQTDEIAGLVIAPILTWKEEQMWMNSSSNDSMYTEALEAIYNRFSNVLPIYYYGMGSMGAFCSSTLCKRMVEEFRQKGYTEEKGYYGIPLISVLEWPEEFESMFKCFIDFYSKKQEADLKLERVPKINP